jgi:hypothetical protein
MTIALTERQGSRSASISKDQSTYTRTYDVLTSSVYDPEEVIDELSLPSFPYQIQSLQLDEGLDSKTWLLTVQYGYSKSDPDKEIHPLSRPVKYSISSVTYEEQIDKDVATGKGICNKAGQPFQDVTVRDQSRLQVSATINLAANPMGSVATLLDKLNNNTMFGYAAGKVKFQSASTTLEYEEFDGDEVSFWTTTYTFSIRDSWKISLLNQGYKEVDSSAGSGQVRLKDILDADDKPLTTPVLLDNSGVAFSNPVTATPIFLDFTIYESADLSVLGV